MFTPSGISGQLRLRRFALLALFAGLLFGAALTSIARAADLPARYWIYWGPTWEAEARKSAEVSLSPLSERAERRLARVGYRRSIDQPADRPVPSGFLRYLEELGITPGYASRLLRAVSADLTEAQRGRLAGDPTVSGLVPIRASLRRTPEPIEVYTPAVPTPRAALLDTLPDPRRLTRADYGPAYAQCAQLEIPTLHRLGLSGHGVLVCMLDGGFWPGHEAFGRTDLEATWDFAEHDRGVNYDPNRPGQIHNTRRMNEHGTFTWSALGGFFAGKQIGPAYRASFALGRTEIVEVESREEEELYVAGLEWADSLGADLVSTSLGYRTFQDGFEYWPSELDGRHAVTSLGAALLTRRGILLVTAMGNEGPDSMSISTPADAESVCSVGAVDVQGRIAAFSSRGPNALGQIKPDVSARGVATACASAAEGNAYAFVNGTSLSTPLIAGLAALLIEAHPEWTPIQVVEALRAAGDQTDHPDVRRGYGVPNGVIALGLLGVSASDQPLLALTGSGWVETAGSAQEEFRDSLVSPGEEGTLLLRLVNSGAEPTLPVWISVAGASEGVESLQDSIQVPALEPGATLTTSGELRVRIASSLPVPASAPLAVRLRTSEGGVYYRPLSLQVVQPVWQTHPYPNPLVGDQPITLDLELTTAGEVTVQLFDVCGRLREEPYRDVLLETRGRLTWRPDPSLPTGVYFLRVQAPAFREVRRVTIIR